MNKVFSIWLQKDFSEICHRWPATTWWILRVGFLRNLSSLTSNLMINLTCRISPKSVIEDQRPHG